MHHIFLELHAKQSLACNREGAALRGVANGRASSLVVLNAGNDTPGCRWVSNMLAWVRFTGRETYGFRRSGRGGHQRRLGSKEAVNTEVSYCSECSYVIKGCLDTTGREL